MDIDLSSLDAASKIVQIISQAITVVAVLGGLFAAMYIYRLFIPHIRAKVKTRRLKDGAIAELELENVSRVALHNPVILFGVKTYPAANNLPERFDFPTIDAPKGKLSPLRVLQSTRVIRPGEIISIEKWIAANSTEFVHVGLQLRYQYPAWYFWPLRLLLCVREISWALSFGRRRQYLCRFAIKKTSWTSTAIAEPYQKPQTS
jgi:hypothetical protein